MFCVLMHFADNSGERKKMEDLLKEMVRIPIGINDDLMGFMAGQFCNSLQSTYLHSTSHYQLKVSRNQRSSTSIQNIAHGVQNIAQLVSAPDCVVR